MMYEYNSSFLAANLSMDWMQFIFFYIALYECKKLFVFSAILNYLLLFIHLI